MSTFSALSIRGGGLAKYYEGGDITVPDTSSTYNTLIINKTDTNYKNKTITLDNGGYLIIDTALKNGEIPKIKILGGTIIFNKDNNLFSFIIDDKNDLTLNFNCVVIINENVKIYLDKKYNGLKIKKLFNYGILLLYSDSSFGSESGTNIYNYNQIRVYEHCIITSSVTNSGKIYIYNEVNISNGRISNDENGLLNIETNGILTFKNSLLSSFNFMIQNLGGLVNIKENGKIMVEQTNKNIEYFIINNHVLKVDGEIINKTGKENYILNDVNSIIYLENNAKISKNIKIINEDNVISFCSLENGQIIEQNNGKSLNIQALYYSKNNEKKYFDSNEIDNLVDYIYELNSSDIEPDVLNTIIFLLLIGVYHNAKDDISEILKLLKLYGFLKLSGYPQTKKQFI